MRACDKRYTIMNHKQITISAPGVPGNGQGDSLCSTFAAPGAFSLSGLLPEMRYTRLLPGHVVRHGISVSWCRSPIQPVPEWADKCDICGNSINGVSAKVSWVNAKLIGQGKTRHRKTVKMKHICRDCRESLRPAQREMRERWKRMRDQRDDQWDELRLRMIPEKSEANDVR